MGQRLYRGHAHKCRKPQVDRANFISATLQDTLEEGVSFAIEGFHILQSVRGIALQGRDAVRGRCERLDRYGNEPANRRLNRLRGDLRQRGTDDPDDVLVIYDHYGGNQRASSPR